MQITLWATVQHRPIEKWWETIMKYLIKIIIWKYLCTVVIDRN